MKKTGNIIFVAACLVLCLLPFVGMVKARTNSTTENRQLASFPKVKEDGKWNREWLLEAGTYFEEHFAFRPYLVTADSEIMSRIFGVSNMDTVIDGKNGWLYYTATLDDYLGAKPLSRKWRKTGRSFSLQSPRIKIHCMENRCLIMPIKKSAAQRI